MHRPTIEHHRRHPKSIRDDLPNIPRLLLQFSNRTCLGGLLGINQSSWNLDDDSVNGWSPLLLQKDAERLARLGGVLQDGENAHAVNV
jgi:hypothetical protein